MPKRPYLPQLNLLRWLTSIGVVCTHCIELLGVSRSRLDGLMLSELHATREVFFLLSALVMTYAYYERRPMPWRHFYLNRLLWLVLPYVVWTGVYFAMSYPHIGGFSLVVIHRGSVADEAHQFVYELYHGIGHLYYVAVLLRFCLVFPLVLWIVRRTERFHLLLVVASLALQIWLMLRVSQNPATNREVINYQLYFVVGCVLGARLPQLSAWVQRWRWLLAVAAGACVVAVEALYLWSVKHGALVGPSSDPFQGRFIPLNLGTFTLLYLAGLWWTSRRRPELADRVVKGGGDNSFGVYLSHGVLVNLLLYSLFVQHLEQHGWHWPLLCVGAAFAIWAAAALGCSIIARTPLAHAVGRARRKIVGSPPAGRFEPVPSPRRVRTMPEVVH